MIATSISSIIGTAILGNFIAHWFSPIQEVKRRFFNLLSFIPFINYLEEALNCSKCSSFWLSLIIFQDLFIAAITSLLGYLIQFLIDYIQCWYEG